MPLYLHLAAFLLLLFPASSQDPCLKLVSSSLEQMSMLRSYKEGTAGMLQLEVTTVYKKPDKKTAQSKAQVMIVSDGQRTYSSSPDSETWTDARYTVSVDKKRKRILIADNVAKDAGKAAYIDQIQQMRDSVLSKLNVKACRTGQLGNGEAKHITLSPRSGERSVSVASISTIDFWIDPRTEQMRQLSVVYKPGMLVEKMTMEVIKADRAYSASVLRARAKQAVLDGKGKLLDQYQGYKLVDVAKH